MAAQIPDWWLKSKDKPAEGEAIPLLSDAEPGTTWFRRYRDLSPEHKEQYDSYVQRWTDIQAADPQLSHESMTDYMPESVQYYFTLLNETYSNKNIDTRLGGTSTKRRTLDDLLPAPEPANYKIGNEPQTQPSLKDELRGEVEGEYRKRSLARRREAGQLDLSMMGPGYLSTLLSLQRTRRRGYAGTILSGLGLDDEEGRRKTLLGG